MKYEHEHLYDEEDYARPKFFYTLYRKALEEILDFRQLESIADLGCQNARLLESVHEKYPHLKITGFDVFEWAVKHAAPAVKDSIVLADLRKPLEHKDTYSIVNCTEIGEHLEPEYEATFLDNVAQLTADILILSWSNTPSEQHFNPRPKKYIISEMKKRGFVADHRSTRKLRHALRHLVTPYGHQWWAEDVVVYQRKRQDTPTWYTIWGTRNAESGAVKHYKLWPFLTRAPFQELFLKLTRTITASVALRKARTFTRLSDGEYYFLSKRAVGSAAPGRRGSTLPFKQMEMGKHRFGILQNDYFSFSPELSYRRRFIFYFLLHPVFFTKPFLRRLIKLRDWKVLASLWTQLKLLAGNILGPSIPHEAMWSLVSSRWIFRAFPNQIGLIGNEHKMNLVKKLMEYPEYQKYLGTSHFTDYIAVPQKGAADRPDDLARKIGEQIENSSAKIFLIGMGHAKAGLLYQLRNYTDAVLIDVGTGIDAIAGCVSQERPHFADWVNYRIKGYAYEAIDQMDYMMEFWDKAKYKTVWLEKNKH